VEVIETEQDGAPPGPGDQELGHGVEEAEPLLVGLEGGGLREIRDALAESRDELGQRGATRTEVGALSSSEATPPARASTTSANGA
jgi:hypothetical protein